MSEKSVTEASQRELTEDELDEVRGGIGGRDRSARATNERAYNSSNYNRDPDGTGAAQRAGL